MRILNPYHHRHHSHYYLFGVMHRAFWIKNIVIQSSGRCFPSFPCSPCSPNLLHVLHNLWNPDIHYHHRKQHATSFNTTVIAINYCISKPLLKIDIHIYLLILFCYYDLLFRLLFHNVAPCVRFPATWGDVKDTSSALRNSYLYKPTLAPTMSSRWRPSEIELHCFHCLQCSQWHIYQHTLLYGWSVNALRSSKKTLYLEQEREYIFFLRNYNKENKQVGLNTLLWGSLLLHTASPIDAQTFGMFPR